MLMENSGFYYIVCPQWKSDKIQTACALNMIDGYYSPIMHKENEGAAHS